MIRETSLISYAQLVEIEDLLGEREWQVYMFIREHPCCTDLEISKGLGKDDPNYVRPRRRSLAQYTLIEERGKRPCAHYPFRESLIWEVNHNPNLRAVRELKHSLSQKHKCPYCEGKGYLVGNQVKLPGFV